MKGFSKHLAAYQRAIGVRVSMMTDLCKLGIISVSRVDTSLNRADAGTKMLARLDLERELELIGVCKSVKCYDQAATVSTDLFQLDRTASLPSVTFAISDAFASQVANAVCPQGETSKSTFEILGDLLDDEGHADQAYSSCVPMCVNSVFVDGIVQM